MAEYVGCNLMAVISSFNSTLSNKEHSMKQKLLITQSITELVAFIGSKNIVKCKYALLDFIRNASTAIEASDQCGDVCLDLWDATVKNLDLSEVVEILPQVCPSLHAICALLILSMQVLCGLLHFIDRNPVRVVQLFKFLLKDNKDVFLAQMPQLVFLPVLPQLEEVMQGVRGDSVEFASLLERLFPSLEHESLPVRLQTLRTLSALLDSNMPALQRLVVCTDQTHPVISALVTRLLTGLSLKEPDSEVRGLAAVCLGKIGPVDPGKLELVPGRSTAQHTIQTRNHTLDMFSVGFSAELLTELARAHASARDQSTAENCSYSTQELLKVFKVNLADDHDSKSWRIWRRLAVSTQEKLTPLLTSMYKREPRIKMPLKSPIYMSEHGSDYSEWLINWSIHLIAFLPSKNQAKPLFDACLPAIKKTMRVAKLLLPRLLVAVLIGGGEVELEQIMLEVKAIIEGVERTERTERLQRTAAQALFSILDQTGLWLRNKEDDIREKKRSKPADMDETLKNNPEYVKVARFKDKMNEHDDGLANLSYAVSTFVLLFIGVAWRGLAWHYVTGSKL